MREVFGPVIGFKVLTGPGGSPNRLDLQIDVSGIHETTIDGLRTKRMLHPFSEVEAKAGNGELVLTLSGQRYVLQAKNPEKLIKKLDMFKNKPAPIKKGTGERCVVCGRNQANATCKQCGGKVCPVHSSYVNGATYCHRCDACPRCKSAGVGSQGRFKTGQAVLGWALGGVVLGALFGAMDMGTMELYCHTCGHTWRPG